MILRSTLFLALSACLAVAGCSFAPRLDASSPDALTKGLAKFIAQGPGSKRAERTKAVDLLKSVYFTGTQFKTKLPPSVPPVSNLHQLRFEDVGTVAARIDSWARNGQHAVTVRLPEESVTERRWRNEYLASQLHVQRDILSSRRELARYRDLFTVDQLQFAEASFIPPQEGVPLGQDKATFVATFTNAAVFNVYGAEFHVVVRDPRVKFPIVDQILKYDTAKLPIQVGETREVQMICCDSFADPTRNLQLRSLREDADISMELVGVLDYSKKNRLEGASFTSGENLKLVATEACLTDVKSRIDVWTPDTAIPACSKY